MVCDRDRHSPEGMGNLQGDRMWLVLPAQPLAPADGHRKAAAQEIEPLTRTSEKGKC